MDRLPSATQASLHIIHTSFHFVCVVRLGVCFERHSILCIPMIPFFVDMRTNVQYDIDKHLVEEAVRYGPQQNKKCRFLVL